MTTPEPAPAYLDPLHNELDRLRAAVAYKQGLIEDISRDCERTERALELAEARVDQLTDELALTRDTLRLRSDAVNKVGATNDTLRAQIARIREMALAWKRKAYEMSIVGGESPRPLDYSEGHYIGTMKAARDCATDLLEILADQEPTK